MVGNTFDRLQVINVVTADFIFTVVTFIYLQATKFHYDPPLFVILLITHFSVMTFQRLSHFRLVFIGTFDKT